MKKWNDISEAMGLGDLYRDYVGVWYSPVCELRVAYYKEVIKK